MTRYELLSLAHMLISSVGTQLAHAAYTLSREVCQRN
jgi:hypothetical protein